MCPHETTIYATRSVLIHTSGQTIGGDVGVRETGPGQFLDPSARALVMPHAKIVSGVTAV